MNDPSELVGVSLASIEHGELAKELYRTLIEVIKDGGALCFSKTDSEPLLWSHYSEKHCGCCIGFEVAESDSLQKTIPIRTPEQMVVNISSLLQFVKSQNFPINECDPRLEELSKQYGQITKAVMLSKYDGWNYERERRLLITLNPAQRDGDHYFAEFDDQLRPVEVLLGVRCSEENREKLRRAVNSYDSPLPIIRTIMAGDAFKIVRHAAGD